MKSQILRVAQELRQKGYEITIYKRKDRGYLITRINGQRFTGAKGNMYARSLTGTRISKKVLQTNRQLVKRYIVKPKLPKRFMKLFLKVQRVWRNKPPEVLGRITMKSYRARISNAELGGLKGAMESLNEQLRYVNHIAYTENIKTFEGKLGNLEKTANAQQQKKIDAIKKYIKKNRNTLSQEKLEKAFQYLYKDEKDVIDEKNTPLDVPLDRIIELFGINV